MKVGDVVKLTLEGQSYVYETLPRVSMHSFGLVVKKYLYEDGDDESNGQDVYDVLIAGQVVQSLFNSEIMLTK